MIATNVQPIPGLASPGLTGKSAIVDVVPKMMEGGKSYNKTAAYVLSVASAWTYSDEQTLWEALRYVGFESRCYRLAIANDALFVRTTATLIQHETGEIAILCFRGTEPTNIINWLADASTETSPFQSWGRVHDGFYRNIRPMWPYLDCRLGHALDGSPVVDKADTLVSSSSISCPETIATLPGVSLARLKALYITGHSFGGALAALAAALIFEDPESRALRDRLFGVYTFGQPAVGDAAFAARCEKEFGSLVFRHVYKKDLAPRFPPRMTGIYRHFGREYEATKEGWSYRSRSTTQAYTLAVSSLLGISAWVKQQIPIVAGLNVPFSLADHSPFTYLRAAQSALKIKPSGIG